MSYRGRWRDVKKDQETRHRRAQLIRLVRVDQHVRCRRCNHPLTSPASQKRGIGVTCLLAEYDEAVLSPRRAVR